MNQINTHDHKIAETLKSLSFEPVASATETSGKKARRFIIIVGLISLVAIPSLTVMVWPEIMTSNGLAERDSANAAATEIATPAEQVAIQTNEGSAVRRLPVAMPQEIAGSGYVVAPQSVALFPKYGGILDDLAVEVGTRVEAGQIVAVLEDAKARFALEQAKAALVSAKLTLAGYEIAQAQAQASLERVTALAARNVASGLQVDEANSALQIAQNVVAQGKQSVLLAELAIRIAREPVDALSVRAPINGTVTQLNASIGDRVLASSDAQGLLMITNTDALVIDADVAEANIALLQTGLRGEAVLDGFPDTPFAIELIRIAPVVSAAKGTVSIRLRFDAPPTGIRPNMAVRIRISAPIPATH